MSPRMERALKGLILIGLALFLTSTIINGSLLFYINRRFAWLTWVATILLLLIAWPYRGSQHAAQHDHDENSHEHHDHHHGGEAAWIAIVLVALPLLLGILVPPRPLGAQAVGGREVNTDGIGLVKSEGILTIAASERNILDWLRAFYDQGDASAFDGQQATVTGFVFYDETYPDDEFMLSRFVVACCVADATAVGLVVSYPGSRELPLDSWVTVQGTFKQGDFEGEPTPILIANDVTPTLPPDQPYLYP